MVFCVQRQYETMANMILPSDIHACDTFRKKQKRYALQVVIIEESVLEIDRWIEVGETIRERIFGTSSHHRMQINMCMYTICVVNKCCCMGVIVHVTL